MRLAAVFLFLFLLNTLCKAQCDAEFTTSENNPCGLEIVNFTVNNPASGFTYDWNFGDPQAETNNPSGTNDNNFSGASVQHAFTAGNTPSTYTVTLTVRDSDGTTCDTETTTITTKPAPAAVLERINGGANIWSQCPAQLDDEFLLALSNTGSTGADQYQINFGDGSPPYDSSDPPNNVQHTYPVGSYILTYTITDNSLECPESRATYFVYNGTNPGIGIGTDDATTVCAPGSIEFALSSFNSNTDNTQYFIIVNDGRDTIEYDHANLPTDFSIDFNTVSCGFDTEDDMDAFEVEVLAINPCGLARAARSPIRVGRAPIPDFTINPDPEICETATHTFVNRSTEGVDIINSMCSEILETQWNINANDGGSFEIIFGNEFSDSIVVDFTGGEYDVTMVVENGCGNGTKTETICVISFPESDYTFSNADDETCTPLTISTTNNSNLLASCQPDADYTWVVLYDPGECGSEGRYTLLNTTTPPSTPTLNDQDIRIRFDSSGIYQLGLIVENECGIDTSFQEFIVAAPPEITIEPISDSCFYSTITILPTLSTALGCSETPTFSWDFDGGTGGNTTSESPGPVTYDAPGTYTIVVTAQNGCGPTTTSRTFTLSPPPPIPEINVTSPVCVGSLISATAASPPLPTNLQYAWIGPNGFSASTATWTIDPVTVDNAGTYTLTVTDQNGCVNTEDYVVEVTTSAPIAINGPEGVCLGAQITLTASGGVTYTWQGEHLNMDMGNPVIFTGEEIGDYEIIVIGEDPNGQCNGSDTLIATVYPLPEVDAGEPRLGCVGRNFQFEGTPAAGTGNAAAWSGDNVSPAGVFNTDVAGRYELTYTFTDANGCVNSDTTSICVRDVPMAAFELDVTEGCLAGGFTLRPTNTSNTLDDCSAAGYNWSVTFDGGECNDTGGFTFTEGTSVTSANPVINFTASGIYVLELTVSSECGQSSTNQIITVNDQPTVVIDEYGEFCGSQAIDFLADISACNGPITAYAWSFSGGDPEMSDQQNPDPVTYGIGDHTVTLAVTNACGTTMDSEDFRVLEGPEILTTVAEDTVCAGQTIMPTGTSTGSDPEFEWTYTGPGTISFSSTTIENPTIDFSGATVGDYVLTLTIMNSVCAPVVRNFDVFVNDVPVVSLDPLPSGCGVVSLAPSYTVSPTGVVVESYLWELNDGTNTVTIGSSANPMLADVTERGDYTLTLTVTNDCGSNSASQSFSVLEGPDPAFTVDGPELCRDGNNSITFEDNSGGDIDNYSWTVTGPLPATTTIFTSSDASPTFTFGSDAAVGDYRIEVLLSNSECNPATPWDTTIALLAAPMVTIETIPDDCGEITLMPVVSYNLDPALIDSIYYEVVRTMGADAGAVIYSGEAVSDIEVVGPGQYTLTVTAFNRCAPAGVSETASFFLSESPTGFYTTNTDFVCRGPNGTVTTNFNFNGNITGYNWTVTHLPTTQIITEMGSTEQAPAFTFTDGLPLGDYQIAAELANPLCGNITWDTIITLNAMPGGITINSINDACTTLDYTPSADFGEFTELFLDSVRWTFPDGSSITTSDLREPPLITQSTTGTDLEVSLTVYNPCGEFTNATSFNLFVGPEVGFTLDTNFVCVGESLTPTNTSTGDNPEYLWTVTPSTGVTIVNDTDEAPTITFNSQEGDFTITLSVGNDLCGRVETSQVVRVNRPPVLSVNNLPDGCGIRNYFPVVDYSLEDRFIDSVRWTIVGVSGTNAGNTVYSDTLRRLAAGDSIVVSGPGVYLFTATAYNGCAPDGVSVTDSFRLFESPLPSFIIDTNFVCHGGTIIATNTSSGDITGINWTVTGPGGATLPNSTDDIATFNFTNDLPIGAYTITLSVSNPACGSISIDTTIRLNTPPLLTDINLPNGCGARNYLPEIDYGIEDRFIDSVRWTIVGVSGTNAGNTVYSDTLRRLAAGDSIVVSGPGVYLFTATAYNGCAPDGVSVTDSFRLFESPLPSFTIDTNFVCHGGTIIATNTSSGDITGINWTVTGPGGATLPNSTDDIATFNFTNDLPIGAYTITLSVSNPACGSISIDTTIRLNTPPLLADINLPDGCGARNYLPEIDYGIEDRFIDSVRWTIVGVSGTNAGNTVYSDTLRRLAAGDSIVVSGPGVYLFTATAYNGCAPDGVSVTDSFRLFESPLPSFTIDTNFVCHGGTIIATNTSSGDITGINWTVTGPGGATLPNSTDDIATFNFTNDLPIGAYTITLSVSNPACGTLTLDTIIRLSTQPVVTLDSLPDFCEEAVFAPVVSYHIDTSFIDSVRWILFFEDSIVYTSTLPYPDTIRSGLDGAYTLEVTAYNGCGTDREERSFNVLEGPDPLFALNTNFICIGDTLRVVDSSGGDGLLYDWMVDETVFELVSQGEAQPFFVVNGPVGTYDIRVNLSNTVCTEVPWSDTVRVSDLPGVMIVPPPDFCDTANVVLEGFYTNELFIDSVSWTIRSSEGTLLFSSDSLAPAAAPLSVGRYTISASVFNDCGESSDTDEFQIFAGPELDISLDTNFVCLDEEPTVTVTNHTTGDSLSYLWTVDPISFMIDDDRDTTPTITFLDTGFYVITVEVSNPVCDPVFWSDTVLVSQMPQISLAPIDDDCGEAQFTPLATFRNLPRLDSVRWYFPGAAGDSTSTLPDPGQLDYLSPGTYSVSVVGYNSCGRDSAAQTFRVLEPLVVTAELDTNFSCTLPLEVNVTNMTSGDDLNYDWSVSGPFAENVSFVPDVRDPVITINDTGVYVITLRVFNDICGEQFWRDTVTVLTAPSPLLVDQTEFCETVSLAPEIDYLTYRIDSVHWNFPGSQLEPPTSTALFPTDIPYSGAGTYTYSVTAYNRCGETLLQDTFVIDTIPEVVLGPTDTICRSEGLYTMPPALPVGGFWRDSLGRPGVITMDGIFDPDIASEEENVVEYVFREGQCEVITPKIVFVVDLSFVSVEPPVLNACVTDTAFVLDNGTPGPGWYVGPGITDTLGVMNPSSLGLGSYILQYFYQLPGTECVEVRPFTVNVQPPPEPAIGVTDSICVDVPVDLLHTGAGAVAWEWTTGDGGNYFVENALHTFTDTGFQSVQLISTSEFQCQDSVSREVYVSGPPVALFTKDTTMGCALLPVNFDNESIGFQWVRYRWDFGNGETSNEEDPLTVFYDQGLEDTTYFITLLAQNACGEDFARDSVIVLPTPRARIELSQTEGCTPLYVEFTNVSKGLPERFEWYIDGELYSTDSLAPDRSFIAPDSMNVYYDIMLIAFNECGADTAQQTIAVLPDDIRAFFTVDDQTGCEPYTVQFHNFSDPDSLITYDWFFGDGSTSQEKDPEHTFVTINDSTTVYDVILVANNGCGQDSIIIPITVEPAPVVSFTAPPITCARDTVFFTNTSIDVVNPIWVFGDGDTLDMVENPGYVFDQPGTYTVMLTAFAITTGCPNTWEETIIIREIPTANLGAAPAFGCPPLDVTVTNLSDNADFYFWDYGDGNTTVGPNPDAHRYTEPGVYPITLTARDEFGCRHDTVFEFVQVYEVPQISFETAGDRPCGVPVEICFENNSELGGDYRWDFGNGQTSNENNPCINYEQPGQYTISLLATNEFLCSTDTSASVTVYGIPEADFTTPSDSACAIATVPFINTSVFAEYAEWTFSDGFLSSEFDVSRVLADTGAYDVTLIVGNGSGCMDTVTRGGAIRVFPSPFADFEFMDRPDLPRTTLEFTDLSSEDAIIFGWDFEDGFQSDERDPVHRFLSSFDKEVSHWVINQYGCADTAYAVIDLDTLGALYIPNILEPDDRSTAGKEVFQPTGIGLAEFYIAVYARTGQLVWESDRLDDEGRPEEAWDGKFRGQELAPGTYIWRVERARYLNGRPWEGMQDENGQFRTMGYIYLVR